MRVLVTGGAGFVGANVAVALTERHPNWEIVTFDNLRRRGSELNLARLREAGLNVVRIYHVPPLWFLDRCAAAGITALSNN